MPINVLVYDGPGVSQTSLSHTVSSLRTLLRPNYTVNTITAQSLISDPWPPSCALLVIPGGRDLPYVASLDKANARIKQYVRNGGCFLGLCAGAYYASGRVEWEVGTPLEVVGQRTLGFFPGVAKGCVFKGFVYESEDGAHAINVEVDDVDGTSRKYEGIYYNGGGSFDEAEKYQKQGVRVLARYLDGDGQGKVAAVLCDVDRGRAILWGPHVEYPLEFAPANAALAKAGYMPEGFAELEKHRWRLMKGILELLNLRSPYRLGEDLPTKMPRPLPQILVSSPSKPGIMAKYKTALAIMCSETSGRLQDANDLFQFRTSDEFPGLYKEQKLLRVEDDEVSSLPRDIVVFESGTLPESELTRHFNLSKFFGHLAEARSALGLTSKPEWGMGETLLYGEVVTSTQTIFDKNPVFTHDIPAPLLSLATNQLAGRGRGANVWLSQAGGLQFSLLLRPPPKFPLGKVPFLQYLFGLAVTEACRTVMPGTSGEQVRLKWPNDIYAVTPDGDRKKLGGILCTTNYMGGQMDVVIGCGLNVLNPLPTTSLSKLMPSGAEPLSMERVMATIMSAFEQMWDNFVENAGSWEPFKDLYLNRWLHSDELVTVTSVKLPLRVRILGISPDHGLLQTMDEKSGEVIELRSDMNSFDIMAGLIKPKN